MTPIIFLIRLGISVAAALFIGLEREMKSKDAGMRTHILVALGATSYVLLSVEILADGDGDATRIVGQVITGIGFLGAGVILREGGSVHGLTTAATIWVTAAVGCLAGLGLFWETGIVTGIIILVNTVMHFFEEKFIEPDNPEEE